jgi:hypothetical protein
MDEVDYPWDRPEALLKRLLGLLDASRTGRVGSEAGPNGVHKGLLELERRGLVRRVGKGKGVVWWEKV